MADTQAQASVFVADAQAEACTALARTRSEAEAALQRQRSSAHEEMQQMPQSMRGAYAIMRIEAEALSVITHNEESARRDLAAGLQSVSSDAESSSAAAARARQLA